MRSNSIVGLLLVITGFANAEQRPGLLMSFTRVINGIQVTGEMVAEPPAHGLVYEMSGASTEKGKRCHRYIVGGNRLAYFGYDLTVEPVAGTSQIRVLIEPLTLTAKKLNGLL